MITAEKKPLFSRLFHAYQSRYLIPRHFSSIEMKGRVDAEDTSPVLYIANHSSWWDGLLIFQLVEAYSIRDHYMMMTEEQLTHYRFFRKLGAFSINRSKPSEIIRSLQYTQRLMKEGQAVWIFPQGEIMHQDVRPLPFMTGVGYILKGISHAHVIPVTLNYSFFEAQKPTASITFGEAITMNWKTLSRRKITETLRKALETQLDAHKNDVINDPGFGPESGFQSVLKKGVSTSDRFDRMKRGLKKWPFFSRSSS